MQILTNVYCKCDTIRQKDGDTRRTHNVTRSAVACLCGTSARGKNFFLSTFAISVVICDWANLRNREHVWFLELVTLRRCTGSCSRVLRRPAKHDMFKVFTRESSYCFQRVLAIAILSVCPSVTRVDQLKMVQARITKSLPSAAWKTLVSETIKLFHKFEKGHPERGC